MAVMGMKPGRAGRLGAVARGPGFRVVLGTAWTRAFATWRLPPSDPYGGQVAGLMIMARVITVGVLRAPVSRRSWRSAAHLAAGVPLGAVGFALVMVLGTVSLTLLPTVILAFPVILLLLWVNRMLTLAQRSRFAALLGVSIQLSPPTGPTLWRRMWVEILSPTLWRQLGYHLLAMIVSLVGFCLAGGLVAFGLLIPAVALRGLGGGVPDWQLMVPDIFGSRGLAFGAAIVALFLAPWAVRGMAAVDAALAEVMLGRSTRQALRERVSELVESRAALLDAIDAERRRIERDLHDGAQQRLTTLAMYLGALRRDRELPDSVRGQVIRAHDEAKLAARELRFFARGLHPAVLEDRGLDAALSGIVGSCPVPVRLSVRLPRRPPPGTEAVAYYVASESLTNVAKHAQASAVSVDVVQDKNVLRVRVADNGRGGAREADGSGLSGLRKRVAAVDGHLEIVSRPGEGTTVTVGLPCGS